MLQCNISIIVAACSQEEYNSKERSDIMEPNYLDIEALVQQARKQRSLALGEAIFAGWSRCKKLFIGRRNAASSADNHLANSVT